MSTAILKKKEIYMFKILSIDGGGAKTLLSIYIILEIEKLLEQNKIESEFPKFDLYAGTSAGSIVASALAIHKSPEEIATIFEKFAPKVFSNKKNNCLGSLGSQYSTKVLNENLKETFKDITFNDVYYKYQSRLLIPVAGIDPIEPKMLKTPHNTCFVRDGNISLHDAITSSSSAPPFFDPHYFCLNHNDSSTGKKDMFCTDGGLYMCNPSLAALIEVPKYISNNCSEKNNFRNLDNIKILSIANITNPISYPYKKKKNWGLLKGWENLKLIESIMEMQKMNVDYQMSFLLNDETKYLRLKHTCIETIALDCDTNKFKAQFKEMAKKVIKCNESKIIKFFEEK